MVRWWRDLSVAKKLYAVVGMMALLITSEMFTLLFAMNTLSSLRAFVEGEALWSKAQKDAVHDLYEYALNGDEKAFTRFQESLSVNLGDRQARLELLKAEPNLDIVDQGFRRGQIHPNDIPGVVRLLRRFSHISYVNHVIVVWTEADLVLDELIEAGDRLHELVRARSPSALSRVPRVVEEIHRLNVRLTDLEIEFSQTLGAGSRWLEGLVMTLLLLMVAVFEGTGLFLTFRLSRSLNRSLGELGDSVGAIKRGDFTRRAPVRSRDELGRLAGSINEMAQALQTNVGRRREAESASQEKTMFLANVSHEIRSPLGVILGLSELLKDPNLSWDDHRHYVGIIERTGKNLTRIVNDVLDISKVEAGHLSIERTRFALADFIEEVSSLLSVQAQAGGNRLLIEIAPDVPADVVSDRTRLRQILVNLVGNALKFTSQGTVTLRCQREGDRLAFRVIDTGPGISADDREKLFQMFSRVGAREKAVEGTGLGLVLAKRLAAALGGDVVLASSELGRGSEFVATIDPGDATALIATSPSVPAKDVSKGGPKASVGEPPARSSAEAPLEGRVLVADDSPDNLLIVKMFLSKTGLRLDFARDGGEAYRMAKEGDHDVVLMDMQMPVMDGYEVTRRLRAEGYAKPVIALTAHAMKEDRDRCLAAGCTDYLSKPIESLSLRQAIARALGPRPAPEVSP